MEDEALFELIAQTLDTPDTPGGSGVAGKDCLLIIREGTSGSMFDTDILIRDRLINTHGYTVTVVESDDFVIGDISGMDFVWISGSVLIADTNVGTLLRTANVPIVCSKGDTAIELDMSGTGATNAISGISTITIETPSDPLAAGKNHVISVYNDADSISIGIPNSNAVAVAQRSGSPSQKTIYYYNSGVTMYNSLNAPNKRAAFFLTSNIETGVTQNTLDLFDAMITYITT